MSQPVPQEPQQSPSIWQPVAVFAGVFATAAFVLRFPPFQAWSGTLIPLLFVVASLEASERGGISLEGAGLDFGGLLTRSKPFWSSLRQGLLRLLREAGVAVLVAVIVYVPYAIGYRFLVAPESPFQPQLPPNHASFLATHLLMVAVPEEMFFRGYLQTAIRAAHPPSVTVLGVRVSLFAWMTQATLFALIHLAGSNSPGVLAVFFPGLLFGWVRAWRGGIAAAVVLHGLANLLGDVLARS